MKGGGGFFAHFVHVDGGGYVEVHACPLEGGGGGAKSPRMSTQGGGGGGRGVHGDKKF